MKRVFLSLVFLFPAVTCAQWSVFDPISQEIPPPVENDEWSAPIDAFVYARLHTAGLTPAPAVGRRVWIRRVTYDLVGLPPAPDEVQAFVNDARPDPEAMGEVIDRLLESPRYGERWGRHWLDVVRYADTDGFAIDAERLWLWRYRDYVIRSFNEGLRFDQFIREQIAGDEIDAGDRGRLAISYYRVGPWEADNMMSKHRRQDYLNDITSNIGSAFLGLTIGCARCHDHKFDPIPQTDFYQLQAFFTPISRCETSIAFLPGEMTAEINQRRDHTVSRRLNKINALRLTIRKKIAESKGISADEIIDEDLDLAIKEKQAPVTEEDAKQLNELMTAKEHLEPEQRFEARLVSIGNEGEEPPLETFVLKNGDPHDPGAKVVPGFLSSLPVWSEDLAKQAVAAEAEPGNRRKLLAEWLTSPNNPIPLRVLANRVWHYHFGAGLVSTPNDLGKNGSGPSHPKLLDYLVRRLLAHRWHLKPFHRELLLSRTYRSATAHPQAKMCNEKDPDNRLLWRANLRRLESETIRDSILAVSGQLRLETGGPGFFETLPAGMKTSYSFFKWNQSSEEQRRRRSVFMFQRRNLIHPMMETFDGADLNHSCERRKASVTAPQALALFNGQFATENSLHLARRVLDQKSDDAQRVGQLFWLTLSRPATVAERNSCVSFLAEKRQAYAAAEDEEDELLALRDLSMVLINTNEFLYID